jgi:hypothetical protein
MPTRAAVLSASGTKLSSGDVRTMVAIEGKADIQWSAQKDREWAP